MRHRKVIFTVTLNVALDEYYYVPDFTLGNVHRVARQVASAGGKGLNVARVIHQLGKTVKATGIIGGFTGQRVLNLVHKDGLSHSFIEAPVETRRCINIVDSLSLSTELLESGEELEQEYLDVFVREFTSMVNEAKVVTLSGSAMLGMPKTIYAQLVKLCKDQGIPVILDTSGDLLRHGIEMGPTLIKPNQEELGQLVGSQINTIEEVISAGQKLLEKNIEYIVVSLGEKGAVLIMKDQVIRAVPPKMNVVNVVGSGDSMVAALAVSILEKKTPEEMLRYGVAISALNTLSEKTGDVSKSKVEDVLSKVYSEKWEAQV